MVPLAIVGVIILVSSVVIVGYVQTRDQPEPDIDAQLAIDQTEANMQTVVRDSATRASEQAASQPLTDPAATEFGFVLNGSAEGLAEDPFRNYVRALIYLEVRENLDFAGREEGRVETSVRLPNVTNATTFRDAIRRVDIENRETELGVRLSNITLTATYDGEVIETRETTIEVTIVTPLMQTHERVQDYQYAIDEAPVYEPGFSQRFNARIYALGWARGWAQNYKAPIAEVLANRHIEPSANSALFRTQQDVFGDADPNLRNAVRLGWLCMALKDGEAMFNEYQSQRENTEYEDMSYDESSGHLQYNATHQIPVPGNIAGRLCSGAHLLHDKLSEGHPAALGPMDLIGGTNLLQETETVDIGKLAYLPLAEMVDPDFEYSFENAIQRVFTIEGAIDAETTVRETLDVHPTCDSGTAGPIRREGDPTVETHTRRELPATAEYYYEYQSTINVEVTARRICTDDSGNETWEVSDMDTYSLDVRTLVRENEASPNAMIDDLNPGVEIAPEHKYNPGPAGWGPTQFTNYQGAPDQVTTAMTGGVSRSSHEQFITERLLRTPYENDPPPATAFEGRDVVELDYEQLLGEFRLKAMLTEDILSLQERTAGIEAEFERRELVTGNPMGLLIEEFNETIRTDRIEKPPDSQYASVGQKVRYEARYMYYRTLLDRLTDLEAAHSGLLGEIRDRLPDVGDDIQNATQYLQQGLRQQQDHKPELASSNLTGPTSYEITGSPTYLLSETTVTSERVPAVDQGTEFAALRARNTNLINMPYDDVINDILQRIAEWAPGLSGTPDAKITLRMAGDVLLAGDLSIEAHEEGQATDRNDTYLQNPDQFEENLGRLERNVNQTLQEFATQVTDQTVAGLYPSPAAECIIYDDPFRDENYPGLSPCRETIDEQERLAPVIRDARPAVEDGVRTALSPYDTAETALLIGTGNATEYIIENVTRELDDPPYRSHEEFDDGYDENHWGALIDSAVRPAVVSASSLSVEVGTVDQAENLDRSIQSALSGATSDLIRGRITDISTQIGQQVGERWLGNVAGTKTRAARVPAGLPILPIPGMWIATVNAWTVEVDGRYARFEVSANMATPTETTELTYVRENLTVSREIGGHERELGAVEPISFDRESILIVATPPGVGVGDRTANNPECSPTFPHVGPVDSEVDWRCENFTVGNTGGELRSMDGLDIQPRTRERPAGATIQIRRRKNDSLRWISRRPSMPGTSGSVSQPQVSQLQVSRLHFPHSRHRMQQGPQTLSTMLQEAHKPQQRATSTTPKRFASIPAASLFGETAKPHTRQSPLGQSSHLLRSRTAHTEPP
jgi:hypothetical protein